MFRTIRQFGAGVMLAVVMSSLLAVSACNLNPSVPTSAQTPLNLAGNTPVPASGPTVAETSDIALEIINAMPAQIGRFTLSHDPALTYVGTVQNKAVGVRVTYTTSSGAQLDFSIWIGQDTNYPVDRYVIELQRLTPGVQAIPVEIGDRAFVAPTNKGRDDNFAFNPNPWGIAVFRNIAIDVYPSKTLTDQTSTTQDEVEQLLKAAVNAIPK